MCLCSWSGAVLGTNDENARGSPEKGGQPPGDPSSCCPAVGPLPAPTCPPALLAWLPRPAARVPGAPEAAAGLGSRLSETEAPAVVQADQPGHGPRSHRLLGREGCAVAPGLSSPFLPRPCVAGWEAGASHIPVGQNTPPTVLGHLRFSGCQISPPCDPGVTVEPSGLGLASALPGLPASPSGPSPAGRAAGTAAVGLLAARVQGAPPP